MTAVAERVHRYRPVGRNLDVFTDRSAEVLVSGPAGTGKSRACLEKLHAACLATPYVAALIVRKTRESLGSTALETYRKFVAHEAILSGEVRFFGGNAEKPAQYRYGNGSTINIGGMDKPDKIMSSEYDMVYAQEATELTIDDWEAITTRLRNGRLSFQQLLADCNPGPPTHWLKQRSDEGKTSLIITTHRDNPILVDPRTGEETERGRLYLSKLERLTGHRKRRLLYGEWVAADGVVYENWDAQKHICEPFPIPDDWPRFWGIDFGYRNPMVVGMWAHEPSTGRLYCYREYYRSKMLVEHFAQWVLDDIAPAYWTCNNGHENRVADDAVLDVCTECYQQREANQPGIRKWSERQPRKILVDHDAEDYMTWQLHTGLRTTPAHKDVLEGVQAVEDRLLPMADGKPGLLFMRGCERYVDVELREAGKPVSTVQEFPGYTWAPPPQTTTISPTQDRTRELPGKANDHGLDETRYVVAHFDLKRKTKLRVAG